METLGALTLGGAVSDTIRKRIVDPALFNDTIPHFMIGQACAMMGAACWQILASVLKMPVSGKVVEKFYILGLNILFPT
jgi:phosphate/sulfate permease